MRFEKSIIAILSITGFFAISCGTPNENKKDASANSAFSFSRMPKSEIIFLSTQMNPVEEAAKVRNVILRDFPGKVDFRPNDNNYLFSQIDVLLKSKSSSSILVGALHADLFKLWEDKKLRPMDDIRESLSERGFLPSLVTLSRLSGKSSFYIPWMQASYIMVANRKALDYLPKDARLGTLTYAQLLEWGKNIHEKTGKKGLGFPAGEKGLMHRFFQGYLYPSFTGSTLLRFKTDDAVAMWSYFKDLWGFVNPASLTYSTMAEPLLAEDVLVGWDHTARLVKALDQRPQDFIAFEAPLGPKGRGVMPVVSGLAIPAGSDAVENQTILIDYLTQPDIQARTLRETGFFPVLDAASATDLPSYLRKMRAVVTQQLEAPDSITVLMPIGLGNQGGDFNSLYMLTFSSIVLEGKNIQQTLRANAAMIQKILNEQNARCWLPDVSDKRPCQIE